MRLIDADRLKRSFEANTPIAFQDCVPGIHAIIDLEPTIEAEPVKTAKWWRYPLHQFGFPNRIYMIYMCSECKHKVENKTPYCPWCGAKMDDQEQDTKFVYCKDCRYNNGGRCAWHGGAGYKWVVDDDDYCSVGERRTE